MLAQRGAKYRIGRPATWAASAARRALCTPDFLARIGGLATPADLLTTPRIGAPESWAAWFAAAGVDSSGTQAPLRLSADAQALEVATALAGQGVALGSPIFFAQEIAQGRLVAPFDIVTDEGGGYWLAYPAERRRVRKIAAFRDWILAQAAADPLIARYRRRS